MKILYDHQAFSTLAYGGVSRIYFELMDSYARSGDVDFQIAGCYSDNVYIKGAAWAAGMRPYVRRVPVTAGTGLPLRLAKNFIIKRINNHRKALNQRDSLGLIRAGAFDVFHPTYYDPYFLPHLNGKPFVVTVYDMVHELFPEHFAEAELLTAWKAQLVREASRVIAISENTKADLMRLHHVPEEKIDVVYLASSLDPQAEAGNIPGLPERYLLYVGNRAHYKNFLFFIRSIAPLLQADRSLRVVCGGGGAFTSSEKEQFRSSGVEDRIVHIPVADDAALVALYRRAIAFAYPSLYEGFGIPVLEAFSCGCPVLISGTSSLPEVADGACLSFDPRSEGSIAGAVKAVLEDEALRAELSAKGRAREKEFSWERTAQETKHVYEQAVSKQGV